MAMKNLDDIKNTKQELMKNITEALKTNDNEKLQTALENYGNIIQNAILDQVNDMAASIDNQVLVSRGNRVLTAAENKYYNEFIQAAKSSNPQMSVTNITATMPETIIESVIGDIQQSHPLLDLIDFRNTTGITKFIVNTQGAQLAKWGELQGNITKELSGALKVMNVTLMKLSAFMPISNDMLDLGAGWLDRYVREILIEAIAYALETAIISGTGKNEPIGMCKDVSDTASVTAGVYPDMTATKLTVINPETIGALCAKIAVKPNGDVRPIKNLIFVVNPLDYYEKIMPATTYLVRDTGEYIKDVMPVPCTIVQSPAVTRGKAIFGLAKRYFMGIGMAKNGKIEFDDSVHFLDDERVYKIKTYGNGTPLDSKAFLYLDISKLERDIPTVKTISTSTSST